MVQNNIIDIDLTKIFNYKYTFNPSVIKLNNLIFLICRLQNIESEGLLGICQLDLNYRPISNTQNIIICDLISNNEEYLMLEDPKCFVHNNQIYINYVISHAKAYYITYTAIGKLSTDGKITESIVLDFGKNKKAQNKALSLNSEQQQILPYNEWLVEKNWQFFNDHISSYAIYKLDTLSTILMYKNSSIIKKINTYSNIKWDYGKISGGTNPVKHKNIYYCFFHSWTEWENPIIKMNKQQRKYHIGIIMLETTSPFKIISISQKPILSGSDTDSVAASGHSVVFPGSAYFDNEHRNWVIALGWNDHSCKIRLFTETEINQGQIPIVQKNFIWYYYMHLLKISKQISVKFTNRGRLFFGKL